MYQVLLIILYLAFLSTGLPDALLGSAWPSMRSDFNVSLSYAGLISAIVTICIVISSLSVQYLVRCLGSARVVVLSAFLSAVAILGYAHADSLTWLCLLAIPYGLSAGSIDAVLNNYVALHYSARHMSWLHGVWGLGAAASPIIMGYSLSHYGQWQAAYFLVGGLQLLVATALCLSLPLWKKMSAAPTPSEDVPEKVSNWQALRTTGVAHVLMCFFAYGAIEVAASLWAASYLVEVKQLSHATAATYASIYFVGILLGRFINGLVAPHCTTKSQIVIGSLLIILGVVLLYLPVESSYFSLAALLLIGMGGAPICPALFHAIPRYFGKAKSMTIAGLQLAFSYIGASLMPPILGFLAEHVGLIAYPAYLAFWAVFVILMQLRLAKIV